VQTWLVDRLPPEPEPECWLHPDVEIGPSAIAQLGLFADADIAPGTIVSRMGGRLVTGRELQQTLIEAAQRPDHPYVDTITVSEDLHLILPPGQANHYGNHSCDPNLWWGDAYTLVARRPIVPGEELTSDYATSTGVTGFTMACACGSSLCREVITGEDWRRPELQARYGDHWIPALLGRIRQA
jgi:SET domain-containing protein